MNSFQKKDHLGASSVGFFSMITRFNHRHVIMTNSLLSKTASIIFFIMFLSGCSNPNSENKSSTPAEQTLPESSFKILILGDSLTEGFGIAEKEAYPYLLEYLLNALGGNDGLRGIPIEEIKKNLSTILKTAGEHNIPTLLAGMKIPPNYGLSYTQKFSKMFPELSKEHQIPLIPFLLSGVGGVPEMTLPDRIHPTPEGHQVISKTVYSVIVDVLHKI